MARAQGSRSVIRYTCTCRFEYIFVLFCFKVVIWKQFSGIALAGYFKKHLDFFMVSKGGFMKEI